MFIDWNLEKDLQKDLQKLKIDDEGIVVYKAGLPHFNRNFPRDGITSAILMSDARMMRDQLVYCAKHQGSQKVAYTGEEPGKICHEMPGPELRGYSTSYNACDTTALFLRGHGWYQKLTGDTSLVANQKDNIDRAIEYIQSHLDDGFFVESPKFCGADRFALKVTYWKDSEIHSRVDGEPRYPVVYSLAHIQNMCGLRSAAELLNSNELDADVQKMVDRLVDLFDVTDGTFVTAIDEDGPVNGVSSDSLHSLFYLRQGDIPQDWAEAIAESSKVLETPLGYRVLDPKIKSYKRKYHSQTVWPFEQAMIHFGAERFGLGRAMKVAERIMGHLETDHEVIVINDDGHVRREGGNPQLWTIAARRYFFG